MSTLSILSNTYLQIGIIFIITIIIVGVFYYKKSSSNPNIPSSGQNTSSNPNIPSSGQNTSVNCRVSGWGEWSDCNCPTGNKTRRRSVVRQSENGGDACPSLSETSNCSCPINCTVSGWSEWSDCDKTCDGGTQTHTRTVITNPQYGGQACPSLSETRDCNTRPCDKTYKWVLHFYRGVVRFTLLLKGNGNYTLTAEGGGEGLPYMTGLNNVNGSYAAYDGGYVNKFTIPNPPQSGNSSLDISVNSDKTINIICYNYRRQTYPPFVNISPILS